MYRIPCSRCAKKFRTESGLRWHLLHIHDCRDVEKLLWEPAPHKLAHIAVMKELLLQIYAKGVGMDLQYVRDLTNEYFPEYGSGRPPREAAQLRSTLNTDAVQKPPWVNPINMAENWRTHHPGLPWPRGDESQKDQ